jgi:FkbM family methyltransferase
MEFSFTNRLWNSIRYRIKNNVDYYKYRSRLGLSRASFNRLRRYDLSHFEPMSEIFLGRTVRFKSPFWFLHSIQEIFVDEAYKFAPQNEKPRIIDCGSNIGLSAIYFKRLCPDSRITAFEADPEVFETMRENIEQFGLSDVEMVEKAVWTSETTLQFDSEGTVGGRLEFERDVPGSNKIDVQTIRLRDYLNEKIDFLKLDIEGAEYAVLKDCKELLENVENLFVEYHAVDDEEQKLDEILSILRKAGFRYYIEDAWINQSHPFISKKGGKYEMQLNISAYRS